MTRELSKKNMIDGVVSGGIHAVWSPGRWAGAKTCRLKRLELPLALLRPEATDGQLMMAFGRK